LSGWPGRIGERRIEAAIPVARRNAETAERALLYVALTRAKRSAVVSGWGAMTGFVG